MDNPAPTLTELLHDALLAMGDARALLGSSGNRDEARLLGLQRRICLGLMQQALEQDPSLVVVGDGLSIMVLAGKADPELANAWRKMCGSNAWQATSAHPYPLATVLDDEKGQRSTFWLKDPKEMQDFLQDGIAHAMPLTQSQAQEWLGKPLDAAKRRQLEAQTIVADAMLRARGDTRTEQAQVAVFLACDGAVPRQCKIAGEYGEEMVLAGVLPPDTPLIDRPMKKQWTPWWKLWVEMGEFSEGEEMVPILKKHGIQTSKIMARTVQELSRKLITRLESGHAVAEVSKAADELHEKLSPNALIETTEDQILWHRMVRKKPAMLPLLLKHPQGTKILSAKTQSGKGIWEALAVPMGQGERISKVAIDALLQLVSPDASRGGVLWLPMAHCSSTGRMDLRNFADHHPKFLLGDHTQQREKAKWLLGSRKTAGENTKTIPTWEWLFDAAPRVSGVCPELRLAMHLLRDELLHDHRLLTRGLLSQSPAIVQDLLLERPAEVDQAWLLETAESIRKNCAEYGDDDNASMKRLAAALDHVVLHQTTQAPSVARARHRL